MFNKTLMVAALVSAVLIPDAAAADVCVSRNLQISQEETDRLYEKFVRARDRHPANIPWRGGFSLGRPHPRSAD